MMAYLLLYKKGGHSPRHNKNIVIFLSTFVLWQTAQSTCLPLTLKAKRSYTLWFNNLNDGNSIERYTIVY